MKTLLKQLKQRRLKLKLKQHDMMLRVGVSRQQYQRLESKGNPRLDTLELIAKGLNCELMLIPQEKITAIKALLSNESLSSQAIESKENTLDNDPWKDILAEDD